MKCTFSNGRQISNELVISIGEDVTRINQCHHLRSIIHNSGEIELK